MRQASRQRQVTCRICRASFLTRHSQGKYCSPDCTQEGARKSWRKYGAKKRPERQAYQRVRYSTKRDSVLTRTKTYQKSPAGRRAQKVSGERQRAKFPEKYAARQAVLVALRSGRLKRQPCAKCGAGKAQAHHHNYSKPLDVEWLCGPCHRAEHPHPRRHHQPTETLL